MGRDTNDSAEPYWAVLLNYIYEAEDGRITNPIDEVGEIIEDHELVTKAELTSNEAKQAVDYVTQMDFVEVLRIREGEDGSPGYTIWDQVSLGGLQSARQPPDEHYLRLSSRGFKVAHERRQIELDRGIELDHRVLNGITAIFTIVLGVSIFIQSLPIINQQHPLIKGLLVLLYLFVAALSVVIIFGVTGVNETWRTGLVGRS